MLTKSKLLAAVLGVSLLAGGCDSGSRGNDRWATTENTNVKIDWDKVNQAYKDASGPEDLEKRINEIYEGDEIISISVKDEGASQQVVTGFFDKDKDGAVSDPEKIFTITRSLTGEGQGGYQTQGYGHYAGYHSPVFSIMSGMLMGAMISSMWAPSYVPVAYTTSAARAGALQQQRSSYRAANPERFSKRSQSGRAYGGGKSSTGGSRSRGGRSFGVRGAIGAIRL
jgi:hypothetical protein